MTNGGQELPFQRDLRDALATYARHEWPRDTAKQIARAWNIPLTTAQNILKGHASAATITHVLRTGGWTLGSAVVGAVIGQSLEGFVANEKTRLRHERRKYEDEQQRLSEMADHLRSARSRPRRDGGGARAAERRSWRE